MAFLMSFAKVVLLLVVLQLLLDVLNGLLDVLRLHGLILLHVDLVARLIVDLVGALLCLDFSIVLRNLALLPQAARA